MSWKNALLALVVVFCAVPRLAAAQAKELKIASLAPRGSAWAKALEKGGKMIEEGTAGRVKLKFFFSGAQGDERDVVRKIKLGQLDGSAITAVGLGIIKGDVRVLELPFLFANEKELDFVRAKMAADFEKQFLDGGYVLLAWGDVGWTHLYTQAELKTTADLRAAKMFVRADDQVIGSMFKRLGINGVPLGVPEVLSSLQTGLINATYGAPLAAVSLQWYTKIKFATAQPIRYSIGALVLRKEAFQALSADDQKAVLAAGKAMDEELRKSIRRDNERAKKAMQAAGVTFVDLSPALKADLEKSGKEVWDELSGGKLYPTDLLERVKKAVGESRK
jgi:TRAP-type C4-dicarboxylate transport system substrate-binding protein